MTKPLFNISQYKIEVVMITTDSVTGNGAKARKFKFSLNSTTIRLSIIMLLNKIHFSTK